MICNNESYTHGIWKWSWIMKPTTVAAGEAVWFNEECFWKQISSPLLSIDCWHISKQITGRDEYRTLGRNYFSSIKVASFYRCPLEAIRIGARRYHCRPRGSISCTRLWRMLFFCPLELLLGDLRCLREWEPVWFQWCQFSPYLGSLTYF